MEKRLHGQIIIQRKNNIGEGTEQGGDDIGEGTTWEGNYIENGD